MKNKVENEIETCSFHFILFHITSIFSHFPTFFWHRVSSFLRFFKKIAKYQRLFIFKCFRFMSWLKSVSWIIWDVFVNYRSLIWEFWLLNLKYCEINHVLPVKPCKSQCFHKFYYLSTVLMTAWHHFEISPGLFKESESAPQSF